MTNVKHTPGPWRVVESIDGYFAGRKTTVKAGNLRVLSPWQHRPHPEFDEFEANARLIAAAPDLLGALRMVQELMDGLGPPLGETQASHKERMVRASIRFQNPRENHHARPSPFQTSAGREQAAAGDQLSARRAEAPANRAVLGARLLPRSA